MGDVLIPARIYSEEGTSRHYVENGEWAGADPALCAFLRQAMAKTLPVKALDTVTTDAVYRQTMNKEAAWRALGCAGVDMEAAALLQVCAVYGIPAAAMLLASDGHPLPETKTGWSWGSVNFAEVRKRCIDQIIQTGVQLGKEI